MKMSRSKTNNVIVYSDDKISQKKGNFSKDIQHILEDENTVEISFDTHPDPYHYIMWLFPLTDVKYVKVYLYDSDIAKGEFAKKGFCGLCDIDSNMLFIAKDRVKGKISIDEIMVHELLHYVALNECGVRMSDTYEEYFAYANSLQYFVHKGWKEKDIIFIYLLPYFKRICKKGMAKKEATQFFNQYVNAEMPVGKNTFLNIL